MSAVVRWALAAVLMTVMSASNGWANPLIAQGIGKSTCGRLADNLKPSDGLNNSVNLLLYSWVQGYVSAANISLLEKYGHHVDMSTLDDRKVINMVKTFCQANPDKQPVDAVDEFLRKAVKLKSKRDSGTTRWNE